MTEPAGESDATVGEPPPTRETSRRRVLWMAAALIGVAAPAVAYRHHLNDTKSAVRFDTVKVDRGRVVAKVTASGTLSALVTVQVGSQVSGRLQRIFVDYNSPVRKDQLIAQLDPQLLQAAHEQAKANQSAAAGNLAKAEAEAVDAVRQLERSRDLAARKLIAPADLDTAQATADAAQATVTAAKGALEQARAALHQAQINLAYTDIHSPTDGVVISRNVDVGQTVAASLQAPTLFVIAEDLRKMQVDTSVAEGDIGRLRDGMPASFTVDAYPGETFRGMVRQIRNAPQTVQNVVTYDAVIDVDNGALKLKPGMTANATFVVAERTDVLRVPNAGLRFRPGPDAPAPADGGRRPTKGSINDSRRVFVLDQGTPRPLPIQTGISDGTLTEVLSGPLRDGDLVIVDVSGGAAAAGGSATTPPGGLSRRVF